MRFSSEGSNETVFGHDDSKSETENDDSMVAHSTCQEIKDGKETNVESQEQVQCFVFRMHHNAIDEETPITKTSSLEQNKLIIGDEENVNKSDEGYETPYESVTETSTKDEIKTHERKQSLQTVDQCFDFLKDDDVKVESTEADDEASSTTSIGEESTENQSKLLNEKSDDDEAIQVDAEEESKMNNVCADDLNVYDEALKKGIKHRRGSTLSWMAQKLTQKSSKSGSRNKRPKFGPLFSFGLSYHVAP